MTELSDLSLTGAVGSRDPHVPSQAPFPWQGVLHRIKSSNNMRWLITSSFYISCLFFFMLQDYRSFGSIPMQPQHWKETFAAQLSNMYPAVNTVSFRFLDHVLFVRV